MNEIRTWLDNALIQTAAESYLDRTNLSRQDTEEVRADLERILSLGANDERKNPTILSDPNAAVKTRMTVDQAEWFLDNYRIIDHRPNTDSGFSATVFQHRLTGQYTLSFRSTESRFGEFDFDGDGRPLDQGGDWARDGRSGADGEIAFLGFAVAQLIDAEAYWSYLNGTGNTAASEDLQALRTHLQSPGATLNVTGYSLGGHLATAFTLMHPEFVDRAFVFNAPGLGGIRDFYGADSFNQPNGTDITSLLDIYREMIRYDGGPQNHLSGWYNRPEVDLDRLSSLVAEYGNQAFGNVYESPLHQYVVDFLKGYSYPVWRLGLNKLGEASRNFVQSGLQSETFSSDLYALQDAVYEQKITSIYGHGMFFDPEIVAASGFHPTGHAVWIEDQPMSRELGFAEAIFDGLREEVGDFGETHSITLLIDSLTVFDLMQSIDPSLSESSFTDIQRSITDFVAEIPTDYLLTAADVVGLDTEVLGAVFEDTRLFRNQLYDPDALEKTVNALGVLFTGNDPGLTPEIAGGGFGHIEHRNELHDAIAAIRGSLGRDSGSTTIVSLTGLSAAEIIDASSADTDAGRAYRYALRHLNPFAVIHDGDLYDQHDAVLSDGTKALDLGNFSSEYLHDRAQMLAWKLHRNEDNKKRLSHHFALSFNDIDSNETIDLSAPRDSLTAEIVPRIIFGSNEGANADAMDGTSLDDRLYGAAGHDVLYGDGGDDVVDGGMGNDRLSGGEGGDTIYGGEGDDTLRHSDFFNTEDGAADRLSGGTGDDRYYVGDGDVIDDADGIGQIFVGPAGGGQVHLTREFRQVGLNQWHNDEIDATVYREDEDAMIVVRGFVQPLRVEIAEYFNAAAPNTLSLILEGVSPLEPGITGTVLNDHLHHDSQTEGPEIVGTGGNDVILGLAGDDDLFGGTESGPWGRDILEGGDGNDYLASADSASAVAFSVQVTDFGDVLLGNAGDDIAVGNGGDDQLNGGDGDDFLSGRDGSDALTGGAGNDILSGGAGVDGMSGGPGDDILYGDFDVVAHIDRTSGFSANVTDGIVTDINHTNVYVAAASSEDAGDMISGGDGNDYLNGHNGDDILYGNADDDTLFGWRGEDRLYGGSGDDVLIGDDHDLAGGLLGAADELFGGTGDDRLFGGDGDDFLDGGDNDDALHGEAGNDRLYGGAGIDTIEGGPGNDFLYGDAGDDFLMGGDGGDLLSGNDGTDYLQGDGGNDTYVYSLGDGHDTIIDTGGFDRLLLNHIDLRAADVTSNGDNITLNFNPLDSLTINGWGNDAIDIVIAGDSVIAGGSDFTAAAIGGIFSENELVLAESLTGDDLVAISTNFNVDAGAGNDHYVIGEGATNVTVADIEGANTVALSSRFSINDLNAREEGGFVRLSGDDATVLIAESGLHRIVFADGGALSNSELSVITAHAPRVNGSVPHQSAVTDGAFAFGLPVDLFTDPDAGDEISLTATTINGESLPGWIEFDADIGRFSGIAPRSAAGALNLRVTATDLSGLSSTAEFTLDVLPAVVGENAALFDMDDINGDNGFHAGFGSVVPLGHVNDGLDQGQLPALVGAPNGPASDAGDINGDGVSDFVLPGLPGDVGGAYVVFGETTSASSLNVNAMNGDRGFIIEGFNIQPNASDSFSVFSYPVGLGDVNGDGFGDIGIGLAVEVFEPGAEGAVGVVFGKSDGYGGALRLLDLDGSNGFIIQTGELDFAYAHDIRAHYTGDLNGDGLSDLLVDKSNDGRPVDSNLPGEQFVIYGASGFGDQVSVGSPVDDTIFVDHPSDVYAGGGNDVIHIQASGSYNVNPGSGRNTTYFGAPSVNTPDYAAGSTFSVTGSTGADIYVVQRYGGRYSVRITDPTPATVSANQPASGDQFPVYGQSHAEANTLRMSGWGRDEYAQRFGSLLLDFGLDGPQIHLDSFNPDDVYGGPRDISIFEFDDGIVTYEELVAGGFDIDGTPGDDELRGTNIHDRFAAHGGNDILNGGAGDDRYHFESASGHDVVLDSAGDDTLVFDNGLGMEDLQFSASGDDLSTRNAAMSAFVQGLV